MTRTCHLTRPAPSQLSPFPTSPLGKSCFLTRGSHTSLIAATQRAWSSAQTPCGRGQTPFLEAGIRVQVPAGPQPSGTSVSPPVTLGCGGHGRGRCHDTAGQAVILSGRVCAVLSHVRLCGNPPGRAGHSLPTASQLHGHAGGPWMAVSWPVCRPAAGSYTRTGDRSSTP